MGHLLDLLGIDRLWPEVFDEMVDQMTEEGSGGSFGGEAGRDARLMDLQRRMTGR